MYIRNYYPLKGADYFYAEYNKDTLDDNEARAAVFTKNLKPVFCIKADYLLSNFDDKNKVLIVANDSLRMLFDANIHKPRSLTVTESLCTMQRQNRT